MLIMLESLLRFDSGDLSKSEEDDAFNDEVSAVQVVCAELGECGYGHLGAHINSGDFECCQHRKRGYYTFHEVLNIGTPLRDDLFKRVIDLQKSAHLPSIQSILRCNRVVQHDAFRKSRKVRRDVPCEGFDKAARAAYKSANAIYPPKVDFSLEETWHLPPGAAVVDVGHLVGRELELIYFRLIIEGNSIIRKLKVGDVVIFRAEMSWAWGKCVLNQAPIVTPCFRFMVYVQHGLLAGIREFLVGEYWDVQGFSARDFGISGHELSAMFSSQQVISLAGRAFHMGSFSSDALAALCNRRLG